MITPNLSKSEYYNSCGFLFEDQFYLTREFGLTCIKLNEIKSIKLANSRDLKINFLLFMMSIAAIYVTIFYFDNNLTNKIFSLVMIQPFLIFSLFYKKQHHKLIVITKNYQLIATKVNSNSKNEAEEIVMKVKETLLNNHYTLEAC